MVLMFVGEKNGNKITNHGYFFNNIPISERCTVM